jgi:hypothetical protein
MTLYSEIGFRGKSFTVTGPRENLRVGFTVRSVRIAPGESWQVCTGSSYRGNCNTARENAGNIAWNVQSARPVGTSTAGQSLRGMAAEFFPRPTDARGRVASCSSGTPACAAQAADRFCKTRGWTASSYERQETVAGRIYLADVLCTRTR